MDGSMKPALLDLQLQKSNEGSDCYIQRLKTSRCFLQKWHESNFISQCVSFSDFSFYPITVESKFSHKFAAIITTNIQNIQVK